MTRVTEPVLPTGAARTRLAGPRGEPSTADTVAEQSTADLVAALVATLDRACDELFATVPFLGDQATGARVNAAVDEVVAALRDLRADADDLRRVMTIAERRTAGGP